MLLDQPLLSRMTSAASIDALLAGPPSRRELIDQAATARVSAECSCGCASVWLSVGADTPSLDTTANESPTGNPGYYSLTAHGTSDGGRKVQVTLHVCLGRIEELEIWTGEYGEKALAPTRTLRYTTDY